MTNIYRQLLDLLPQSPLLVGTVAAVHGNGTTTITMPGGSQIRVRGVGVVATQVFVKDGVIESEAPDLPFAVIEV